MQDDIIIATMIRRLRRERDVSQAQVAAALGLPQPVVSKIERGERRIALGELRLICELLGVPLIEFIKEYQAHIDEPRLPMPADPRVPS